MQQKPVSAELAKSAGVPPKCIPGKSGKDMHFEHGPSEKMFRTYYDNIGQIISRSGYLFMFGASGTGKTEISSIFVKKALSLDYTAAMLTLSAFLDPKQISVPDGYSSLYDWMVRVDLLIIDQTEAGRFLPDILINPLERRWNEEKPIFFTASYSVKNNHKESADRSGLEMLEESLTRLEKPLGAVWPSRIAQRFDKLYTGNVFYKIPHSTLPKAVEFTVNPKGISDED